LGADGVITIGIVLFLVVLGAFELFMDRRERWQKILSAVARRHPGLTVGAGTPASGPVLSGRIAGAEIRVDTAVVQRGRGSESSHARVEIETTLPRWLEIAPERRRGLFRGGPNEDIEVGDPDFDGAVVVRGPDTAKVVAVLDGVTRAALGYAVEAYEATLESGRLTLLTGKWVDLEGLEAVIDAGVNVVRAAERARGSLGARLERAALSDPVPAVQRHAFELLRGRATREQLVGVSRRLLGSPEPALCLLAADVLRDDAAVAALGRLIARPTIAHRDRALHLLCELGHPPDEAVGLAVSRDADPRVRAAAARCLSELTSPSAEARVVELLDDEPAVALAAAEALAERGELTSVEALLAKTAGRAAPELREAARRAIAAIQGRGAGAAGQLTIASAECPGGAMTVLSGDLASSANPGGD